MVYKYLWVLALGILMASCKPLQYGKVYSYAYGKYLRCHVVFYKNGNYVVTDRYGTYCNEGKWHKRSGSMLLIQQVDTLIRNVQIIYSQNNIMDSSIVFFEKNGQPDIAGFITYKNGYRVSPLQMVYYGEGKENYLVLSKQCDSAEISTHVGRYHRAYTPVFLVHLRDTTRFCYQVNDSCNQEFVFKKFRVKRHKLR